MTEKLRVLLMAMHLVILGLYVAILTVDTVEVEGLKVRMGGVKYDFEECTAVVSFTDFSKFICRGASCGSIKRVEIASVIFLLCCSASLVCLIISLFESMTKRVQIKAFGYISGPLFSIGGILYTAIIYPYFLNCQLGMILIYIGICVGFLSCFVSMIHNRKAKSDLYTPVLSYQKTEYMELMAFSPPTTETPKEDVILSLKAQIQEKDEEIDKEKSTVQLIKSETSISMMTLHQIISEKEEELQKSYNKHKEQVKLIEKLEHENTKYLEESLENAISTSANQQAALDAYAREVEHLKQVNSRLNADLEKKEETKDHEDFTDIYRTDIQEKTKEIQSLKNNKSQLEAEIQALKWDLQCQSEVISSMNQDSPVSAITEYKDQMNQQKKDFESLRRVKSELAASHTYLLSENQRLKEEIQNLKSLINS